MSFSQSSKAIENKHKCLFSPRVRNSDHIKIISHSLAMGYYFYRGPRNRTRLKSFGDSYSTDELAPQNNIAYFTILPEVCQVPIFGLKSVRLFFVLKGRGFSGIFIGNIDLTNSRLCSTINADFKRQISETGRGVSGCRHRCLYQKAEEVSCPLFVPFHMLQYPQIKKFR